jgi:hypothetical protein
MPAPGRCHATAGRQPLPREGDDLPKPFEDKRPLPASMPSALLRTEGATYFWLYKVYRAYMSWLNCADAGTPEARELPAGWWVRGAHQSMPCTQARCGGRPGTDFARRSTMVPTPGVLFHVCLGVEEELFAAGLPMPARAPAGCPSRTWCTTASPLVRS